MIHEGPIQNLLLHHLHTVVTVHEHTMKIQICTTIIAVVVDTIEEVAVTNIMINIVISMVVVINIRPTMEVVTIIDMEIHSHLEVSLNKHRLRDFLVIKK